MIDRCDRCGTRYDPALTRNIPIYGDALCQTCAALVMQQWNDAGKDESVETPALLDDEDADEINEPYDPIEREPYDPIRYE